jgi:hypothetical protein
VRQLERDLRLRQRQSQQHLADMPDLRCGAFEKLPPRGCVEEEIADLDRRPDVPRGRLDAADLAAAIENLVRGVGIGRATQDARLRNGSDARQRLAAETHRDDAEEILVGSQLAGRVGCERERQLLWRNPAAVVDHTDQLTATVLNLDDDLRRARVDGVLHQLLHDRRGALDDLTGCNPVDE